MSAPAAPAERIVALDVLRGVAVFGILLLNITGFGMVSSGYFDPLVGSGPTEASRALNLGVWAFVSVCFEGTMRALFSILFGAGVVLFLTGGRSGTIHYRRIGWLLVFGLVDAYLLLWNGDILLVYALVGALLYLVRDASPRRLLATALALMLGLSAVGFVTKQQMLTAQSVSQQIETGEIAVPNAEQQQWAAVWEEFRADFLPPEAELEQELELRRGSYASAFRWNVGAMADVLLFILPVVMFWDALVMMLVGMALHKWGLFEAPGSCSRCVVMMLVGFGVGIGLNLWEVRAAYVHEFNPVHHFPYFQWSYHWARLAMALGYLGAVLLWCRFAAGRRLRAGLADVGRMALTNYLGQSLLALLLFTGAGLALVGELQRWQLYPIVIAIWVVQYLFSRWWMDRYRFGPLEGVWRRLTYGVRIAS